MFVKKWKPSKSAAKEFAKKMDEINKFCFENGIIQSSNQDSYCFTINGQQYRISNHSIEASNKGAFDQLTGQQVRQLYHPNERDNKVIYIHASKTRIIDIYNDLKTGYKLDGRGYRVN